jgi:hypothetical protein
LTVDLQPILPVPPILPILPVPPILPILPIYSSLGFNAAAPSAGRHGCFGSNRFHKSAETFRISSHASLLAAQVVSARFFVVTQKT